MFLIKHSSQLVELFQPVNARIRYGFTVNKSAHTLILHHFCRGFLCLNHSVSNIPHKKLLMEQRGGFEFKENNTEQMI